MDKADSIMETRGDKQAQIKRIKDRIRTNKLLLEANKKEYLRRMAPKGYSTGNSYEDYDCIHGGKKEYTIEGYVKEIVALENQIKLDERILLRLEGESEEEEYLKLLDTNKEKVRYLKFVRGRKSREIAEILFLDERYVKKLIKRVKEEIALEKTLV